MSQRRFDEAERTFQHGLALLEDTPLPGDLPRQLRAAAQQATQARTEADRNRRARELHQLTDQLRFLHGSDRLPIAARALEERCGTLWQQRERLLRELDTRANSELKNDLLDLAILWADLRVRLAHPHEAEKTRREALDVLAEAERLFGPSHVLYRDRQAHAESLALSEIASESARRASEHPPKSAWEYYALGRRILRSRRSVPLPLVRGGGPALLLLSLSQSVDSLHAAWAFERALALQPHGFWPNYYHGLCAYRLGRYDDAVAAFSVCIGAAPESGELFFNRALAHAALGRAEQALRDHARAVELKSGLNGGLAAVHYNLAIVSLAREDRATARTHLEQALAAEPGHRAARDLLDRLRDPSTSKSGH